VLHDFFRKNPLKLLYRLNYSEKKNVFKNPLHAVAAATV
jgi:hypothetical protein